MTAEVSGIVGKIKRVGTRLMDSVFDLWVFGWSSLFLWEA